MNINTRIRNRRIAVFGERGGSAFARSVGVVYQTVQQWEKEGGTSPKRERLADVARELKTSPQWLQHGIGPEVVDGEHAPVESAPKPPVWMQPEAFRLLDLYYRCDTRRRTEVIRFAENAASGEVGSRVMDEL